MAKNTIPKERILSETWECNRCGSPCRVQITYSDEGVPEHLQKKTHFRNRYCPAKEDAPKWKLIQGEVEDDLVRKSPNSTDYGLSLKAKAGK